MVEIIQYDNPKVIFLRNNEIYDYPKTELTIDNKKILKSVISLQEDDCMIAMSDGCPHAGIGLAFNFGWKIEDIAEFMQRLVVAGYTAKTLATMLVDQCDKEYGYHPGDDATACVVKVRKREPMNILFGPPRNRDDGDRMMSLFFSKEGKHIICGGTTSSIAAKYLGKPVKASLEFERGDVPPIAEIEGVDLVTEGVITINKVITITGIDKQLKNGQLHLQLIGENLKQTFNYNWEISFDGKIIIPSSIGTTLILSKSNTSKYLNADKVSAIIKVNDYVSQSFEL